MVHQMAFFVGKWCPSGVRPDGELRDEERRTAVFSGPVTIVHLTVFVIFVPILCGFEALSLEVRMVEIPSQLQQSIETDGPNACAPSVGPSKTCSSGFWAILRATHQSGDMYSQPSCGDGVAQDALWAGIEVERLEVRERRVSSAWIPPLNPCVHILSSTCQNVLVGFS